MSRAQPQRLIPARIDVLIRLLIVITIPTLIVGPIAAWATGVQGTFWFFAPLFVVTVALLFLLAVNEAAKDDAARAARFRSYGRLAKGALTIAAFGTLMIGFVIVFAMGMTDHYPNAEAVRADYPWFARATPWILSSFAIAAFACILFRIKEEVDDVVEAKNAGTWKSRAEREMERVARQEKRRLSAAGDAQIQSFKESLEAVRCDEHLKTYRDQLIRRYAEAVSKSNLNRTKRQVNWLEMEANRIEAISDPRERQAAWQAFYDLLLSQSSKSA